VRDAVGFRDSVGDTAPQIARPVGRARENAFITVQNASGSAFSTSIPAVGFALLSARAHQDSHRSLGHTQRMRLWDRAGPSATAPRLARCPSGEGLLATAGPFTRSPQRRNAVVHRLAGWQYEPGRSPVPGQ
jgi:hypothetical protein